MLLTARVYEASHVVGGQVHKKQVICESRAQAEQYFARQRLRLTGDVKLNWQQSVLISSGGVKGAKLDDFAMYFAGLLGMGYDKATAIEKVADEMDTPGIRSALRLVATRIRSGGTSVADALDAEKVVGSDMFITAVRAGEQTSNLETVLRSYAQTNKVIRKSVSEHVKKLALPGIYLLFFPFTMAIIQFLGSEIVGKVSTSMHAEIPMVTQIVMAMPKVFIFFCLALTVAIPIGLFIYGGDKLWKRQGRARAKISAADIRGIVMDALLRFGLTRRYIQSRQALRDLVVMKCLMEGKETMINIVNFMANRKDIFGQQKEAYVQSARLFASGRSIQASFSHAFFTERFKFTIARIANTQDRAEATDSAIAFFLEETDRVLSKLAKAGSFIGLSVAVLCVMMIAFGLYFPMIEISSHASAGMPQVP